jgi:predicted tellurium resistance membrane protein TerC
LLILGLAISIPLIVAGAALIMALLTRLPILVWAGATLLGWIAGGVIATDPAVHPILERILGGDIALTIDATSALFGSASHLRFGGNLGEMVCALLGAIIVLIAGSLWRNARLRRVEQLAPANASVAND